MAACCRIGNVVCLRYGYVSKYRVLQNLLLESKLSKTRILLNPCSYASSTDNESEKLHYEKKKEVEESNIKKKKHEKLTTILGNMTVERSQEEDESTPCLKLSKDHHLVNDINEGYNDSREERRYLASQVLNNSDLQNTALESSVLSDSVAEVSSDELKMMKGDGQNMAMAATEQLDKRKLENDQKLKKSEVTKVLGDEGKAASKLASLLQNMKIESIPREKSEISLKLATPVPRSMRTRIPLPVSEEEKTQESAKSVLDEQMLSAVKDVASTLGGDVKQTESELLRKLLDHTVETKEEKVERESGANMSELFVGMKIDRSKKPSRASQWQEQYRERQQYMPDYMSSSIQALDITSETAPRRERRFVTESGSVDLFGTALNWFPLESEELHSGVELKTWKKLQEKQLKSVAARLPTNPFEEMIAWTEEGKFWTFPIDNEAGMEEEKKVGFHEHVFLEDHLEGFPKKGPVRQFMKLVITGLSMNSYMTVQRKKEHIEWFRQYFKEKEDVLRQAQALPEGETIA